MSNLESDRTDKRVDNGSKKSTSTIAGLPAADIKNALKELHVKKKDEWSGFTSRHFRSYLEKKFNLEHGRLKDEKAIAELCDQVEDDYEEEKKRKKREAEKKS